MLPVRVILNRVYLYLVAGRDAEQRAEVDDDLYAPEGGRQAADEALERALDDAMLAEAQRQEVAQW